MNKIKHTHLTLHAKCKCGHEEVKHLQYGFCTHYGGENDYYCSCSGFEYKDEFGELILKLRGKKNV